MRVASVVDNAAREFVTTYVVAAESPFRATDFDARINAVRHLQNWVEGLPFALGELSGYLASDAWSKRFEIARKRYRARSGADLPAWPAETGEFTSYGVEANSLVLLAQVGAPPKIERSGYSSLVALLEQLVAYLLMCFGMTPDLVQGSLADPKF